MSRPAPRDLRVLRKTTLTPNMLRITFGGAVPPETFPADQASAYVKLMFPQEGSDRPMLRTYTVRAQREELGEIDIDFVLHEDGGPASRWAIAAQPGDIITVGGPGPKKLVDPHADWFLIVGDMTALPAISVNIETLPRDARGYAVIEVIEEGDIQHLDKPENLTIHWVMNPKPGQNSDALHNVVSHLDWPDGKASVWAACEFSSMRKLRDHFRHERGLGKDELYISSYWKLGSNEEKHKQAKREDSEASDRAA
jgi:NADPH-dependent ferric siderophore reductase